ncbi:hypothetical protein J8273_7279 [Carpediemonas membranifera]|uniref:Xanthine dehydrogenase accessory factor n=1 Tax=Carpediemonas membranifera TaxID=201153 RepID=A0A8J6ATD3_9EUKA|nr:hypothetical protein J8273_7279 [Carpediemonas membranifera]|eukprot:KAG9391005.1 hypothetical protein J8273_7279 [Carpediemonas membranifera]
MMNEKPYSTRRKTFDVRVVIRGAGDLATAIGHRLHKAGITVIHTETAAPTTVRRLVSFSSAIQHGMFTVEGVTAKLCPMTVEDVEAALDDGLVPVVIDPTLAILAIWPADVVIDATIAKKAPTVDLMSYAPMVVALGPCFVVGKHCHAAIETCRGHDLGRVYTTHGEEALENTHTPGDLGGESHRRVIRAPCIGLITPLVSIGSTVRTGDALVRVADVEVRAPMGGLVRGMVSEGMVCSRVGFKLGDLDPRGLSMGGEEKRKLCTHISDKARNIAGAALECVVTYMTTG